MPFFGYELQGDGRWAPILYYAEVPTLHVTTYTREAIIEHTVWIKISPANASLPLAVLQGMYPLDGDKRLKNELIEYNIQKRMKKMVRPVEGFLTSQGKFFDTEAKANLFETNLLMRDIFKEAGFENDNVTIVLDLIKVNHELVSEYLQAVKTVIGQTKPDIQHDDPAKGAAGDEVDGSATMDHPPNDTPLWEQEGLSVGDEKAAEGPAASAGVVVEHGTVRGLDKPDKRRKK